MSRQGIVRTCAVVLALLVVLAAASSAWASGGKIVYVCGANLCDIDGDGSNQHALTSDGAAGAGYASPSMSRDGAHMIWSGPGGCCSVGDSNAQNATVLNPPHGSAATYWPRFRPDGTQVLLGTAQSGGATAFADYADPDGGNVQTFNTGFGQTAGFAPDGGYMCGSSRELDTGPLLNDSCNHPVAKESGNNAYFDYRPELSPDGTMALDALDLDGNATNDGIFLYDASTGARLRELDAGAGDEWPTFSPDGQFVLFDRGGTIYKVPTAGGSAEMLVAGSQATWANAPAEPGPGPGPGPSPNPDSGNPSPPALHLVAAATQHIVKQGGVKLKASCAGGCAVIASGKVKLGSKTYRFKTATRDIADGATATIKLKLTAAGMRAVKKALKKHKKVVGHLRVEARNAAPNATVLTGTVKLTK